MEITAIPAFRDNYIWALHDRRHALLTDPGEAPGILAWLEDRLLQPLGILITHHHRDHVGGVRAILERHPVPVYGPARETIPGLTHPLEDGETLAFPELNLELQVLHTPGHTLGHLCYYGDGALFSGDTLFSSGCGRLFEGTPEQMHDSLSRLRALPGATRLYCAHEYTLPNLAFALEVEPDNPDLERRRREAKAARRAGLPTLPSTLAEECRCNPFLRFDLPALAVAASQHFSRPIAPGVAAFAALRAWKDEA